jgi:hypothetical protein
VSAAGDLLTALGDVQVPLLAAMLLGGCAAKLTRAIRHSSVSNGLGPDAIFPLRLREWASGALFGVELLLGFGLILTSGRLLSGPSAELIRLGTGVLFLVATCALIEVRSVRPAAGCGCFGDLSSSPITGRTLARSGLLAAAALSIIKLPPVELPETYGSSALLLGLFAAEAGLFAALSPEVHELLVRIGYSTPCELRAQPPEQALVRLRRSAQWRRHAYLVLDQRPADVWRELCWQFFAYPSRYPGRQAELVFAVYLAQRRPVVRSALVDSATGAVLAWPASATRPASVRMRTWLARLSRLPDWRAAIPRAWRPRPGAQWVHPKVRLVASGRATSMTTLPSQNRWPVLPSPQRPLIQAGHAGSDRSAAR